MEPLYTSEQGVWLVISLDSLLFGVYTALFVLGVIETCSVSSTQSHDAPMIFLGLSALMLICSFLSLYGGMNNQAHKHEKHEKHWRYVYFSQCLVVSIILTAWFARFRAVYTADELYWFNGHRYDAVLNPVIDVRMLIQFSNMILFVLCTYPLTMSMGLYKIIKYSDSATRSYEKLPSSSSTSVCI
jgi:hypothetical protein